MLFPKPQAKSRKAQHELRGRKFRDAVWARDGRKNGIGGQSGNCFRCGVLIVRGETGTVDHKKPRSTHPELKYDPTNGRLACMKCQTYLKLHPLERA